MIPFGAILATCPSGTELAAGGDWDGWREPVVESSIVIVGMFAAMFFEPNLSVRILKRFCYF